MSDTPRITMDFNSFALDELNSALEGCPHCEHDEGGLVNHCDACCRRVTGLALKLFNRPEDRCLAKTET